MAATAIVLSVLLSVDPKRRVVKPLELVLFAFFLAAFVGNARRDYNPLTAGENRIHPASTPDSLSECMAFQL
jgi:hypothetical protein